MSENNTETSPYSVRFRNPELLNEFINPNELRNNRLTTNIFNYNRLGEFEQSLKKDASEFTKDEIALFVKKYSRYYTRATFRNHLNVLRHYRKFVQHKLNQGKLILERKINVADDLISESELFENCYFKKFSTVSHQAVDKVIGFKKEDCPMEVFIWLMCFYFAPTIKELVNMETTQVSVEYNYDENPDKKYVTTLNTLSYDECGRVNFIKAMWETKEGRHVNLMIPDNDNKDNNLNHINKIMNTIGRIAMVKTSMERNRCYQSSKYHGNLILRNQVDIKGNPVIKFKKTGEKISNDDVMPESRIPSLLVNFSKDELELEDIVSYSDLIRSHALYKICTLHKTKKQVLEGLSHIKHIGIDEEWLEEILNEYAYEE